MTDKQYLCITAIKTALQTLVPNYIKKVGEYPDDLAVIGQNYPAVIIEDGNETFDIYSGNTYYCYFEVYCHVYTEIKQPTTKMKAMLDLQAKINHAILADLTLGGNCVNIKLTEVQKSTDDDGAGLQVSHRAIKYTIEIHDIRI
jgi:hypothetical protein